MWRVALVGCLIFSVAVGPSICCCTSSALTFGAAHFLGFTDSAELAQACPFHRTPARSQPAAGSDADRQSRDSSHNDRCPCREGRAALVLACLETNVEMTGGLNSPTALVALDALIRSSAGELLSERTQWRLVSAPPAKTGGDILRAYQHLRC